MYTYLINIFVKNWVLIWTLQQSILLYLVLLNEAGGDGEKKYRLTPIAQFLTPENYNNVKKKWKKSVIFKNIPTPFLKKMVSLDFCAFCTFHDFFPPPSWRHLFHILWLEPQFHSTFWNINGVQQMIVQFKRFHHSVCLLKKCRRAAIRTILDVGVKYPGKPSNPLPPPNGENSMLPSVKFFEVNFDKRT